MPKITAKELAAQLKRKLSHNFSVSAENADDDLFYKACVLVLLDIMRERRSEFNKDAQKQNAKSVYYLSMEFLMGRSLKNTLYNLGLDTEMEKALKGMGVKLDRLYELEPDAGLGNGGLGRLAACFLDSLSTGGYHAMGYCIKYDYGIFKQKFVDGWQTELPDFWLPGGEVWLEQRPGSAVNVYFDGYINEQWDGNYHHIKHENSTCVKAVPYDLMVAGKNGRTVNVLRLWSAEYNGIDMQAFNQGDYVRASEQKATTEAISKVLYPGDDHFEGKGLRLRQQYFLVSASIQDILHRHLRHYSTLDNLPDKVAIHINDTHPALSIPELMRFLLDECGYTWDNAWDIVTRTVAYTNHTVMSEALECWQIDQFKQRLPRIYSIVCEIDNRFRHKIWEATHDADYVERTAIIQGGMIRMANLCVAACHTVNGVSRLHSNILKDSLFIDYYRLMPDKFTNVTNGIAHRRWLCQANPALSEYIKSLIGDGFVFNASQLSKLNDFADDKTVLNTLAKIKHQNKVRLGNYTKKLWDISINPDSIIDMQAKRLHEYKRQHLNALHIISDYLFIKENPNAEVTPKTYIFGAKAAPGYFLAKKIIQMIISLSKIIEADPVARDKIKIVFMEDYRVTLAEIMIPAAEISEQISLASTEASGTGNMKFMLNGAITLGTEDGANVEIHEAVGNDNIIIFGMTTPEVMRIKSQGYNSRSYYDNNPRIKAALDFMASMDNRAFADLAQTFINNDNYMALADFNDYCAAHDKAVKLYADKNVWNRMSLVNIAQSGIFAADRSIDDYAKNIWHIHPLK